MFRKIRAMMLSVTFLFILSLLLLSLIRVIDVQSLSQQVFSSLSTESAKSFWLMGVRFDAKLCAIVLAPLVILGLIFGRKKDFYIKFFTIYGTIYLSFLVLSGLSNHQYIKTYGHHFDLMVFGIVNEEPLAVIKSIWDGYPVIGIILSVLLSSIIFYFILKKVCSFIYSRIYSTSNYSKRSKVRPSTLAIFTTYISLLLFIALWVFFIRGDVGKFPLRRSATAVTDIPAVNEHVPSGLLAFAWTISDYAGEEVLKPAKLNDLVTSSNYFGLTDPYSLHHVNEGSNLDDGDNYHISNNFSYQDVIKKVSFGPTSKPHVVLAVMESMSTDMLDADDEKNFNVLGSLRQVLKNPQVHSFKHFLSEGDGTIDSFSRLLIRSGNNMDHSVGRFQHTSFFTSAAEPYKQAGYRTILVTAGNRGWRNLGAFAQANGFDEIVDDVVIKSHNKKAISGTWGVFDGDMFDEAYNILEESQEPVFMVLLSITNHPPYSIPQDYVISDMTKPNAKVDDKYFNEDIYSMYETFRYANDMLGNFYLKILESSKLKDKTIIAATGDHNVRGLNVYQSIDKQVVGHQVPFILRRLDDKTTALDRYSSQKDIMPTLFEASLNNVTYYYPGCDLFSENECSYDFAYNEQVTVSSTGVCITDKGKSTSYRVNDFVAGNKSQNDEVCRLSENYRNLTQWYYLYQTVGLKEEASK